MRPTPKDLDPRQLARYADAILRPRLIVLARKSTHARAVVQALGWPAAALNFRRYVPEGFTWPDRTSTAAPLVLVNDDLPLQTLTDRDADLILSVEHQRGAPWLVLTLTGMEDEPRSGLMRRLRAGVVGPMRA